MQHSISLLTLVTLLFFSSFLTAQNVGIGTTSPSERLDINGDLRVRGNDLYGDGNTRIRGGGTGYVELQSKSPTYGVIIRDRDDTDYGNVETNANGFGLSYNSGGATDILIGLDRRVGIGGVTVPRATLEIRDIGTTNPTLLITGASGSEGDIAYLSSEAMQIGMWDATTNAFTETMRLTNTLKVGIGTTGPQGRLHILGEENNGTVAALTVQSGTQYLRMDGNEIDGSGTIYLQNNSTSNIGMVNGGGLVGIGTNGPATKLHVVGSENDGTTATLTVQSGSQKLIMDGNEIDGSGSILIQNNSANNIYLANGGGRVGIGVGGGDLVGNYRLYVDNGIMTERVRVAVRGTGNWADYVFADDYDLKSLENVEKFVQKNKHLPNIPSAQQVVDEGYELNEMDAKLLEKIEELYLHTIQLNKENKQLRQELNEVKTNLKRLNDKK